LAVAKKTTVKYSEKDIIIDSSNIIPIQFNPNFKEKYKSSEFQYEVKVEEKGLWDRFLEWLAYWFRKLFGLSDGISSDMANITMKIVATLIVLYVIYMIVKLVLNKEGQWIFGKSTTKKVVSYHDIERNLKNIDFEKLIKDTIRTGDKRLAIRYYYLWLLKKMSEKSIIDWNPEKTNSDYLYEIKNEELKFNFSYVSYLYNYIWYGEFDIDNTTFDKAKVTFETTIKSIK
jgi:hypothetical protein